MSRGRHCDDFEEKGYQHRLASLRQGTPWHLINKLQESRRKTFICACFTSSVHQREDCLFEAPTFFFRLLLLSSSIGLFTFILLQFLQTNSTTLIIIIFDLIFEMAFHLSPSKKALVLSETHSAAQEKGLLPLPPSRRLSRSRHS